MATPWGRDPTAWTLDGRVMHVTRPPLIQLIGLVMGYTPIHVVFGTLRDPDDRQYLYAQVMDKSSEVDNDLLDDVADALVLEWFGLPRWTVQELWWRAIGQWADVDGNLALRGVDILQMSPQRATSTVRALLQKWVAGDDNRREQLRHDLETAPPRVARGEQHREVEAEEAAFDWNQALALVTATQASGGG
ncbi:hypothetical protein ACWFRB_09180 [Rhodococcus sp. NPDC055112]